MATNNMKIRPATKKDLSQLNLLYQILFADMAKLEPYYLRKCEPDIAFLEEIIESNCSDILVAVDKRKLIGFAVVQEKQTLPYTCLIQHNYAFLMDLAVTPESRDRGTGTALLNAVKQWASGRNLDYIELNVLSENLAAIRLYERESYQESMKVMRLKL